MSYACAYTLRLVCLLVFFPWGILAFQRVPGASPVTTDLIMRVNVTTTTTWNMDARGILFRLDRLMYSLSDKTTFLSNKMKCYH